MEVIDKEISYEQRYYLVNHICIYCYDVGDNMLTRLFIGVMTSLLLINFGVRMKSINLGFGDSEDMWAACVYLILGVCGEIILGWR